jgi:hypothetical protein
MKAAMLYGIEEALRQCGVADNTLPPIEREALDTHGYVLIQDVMDAPWLKQLRVAFEGALGRGQQAINGKQSGTRHVDGLAYEDAGLESVYTHPRILAAAYHVLNRAFRVFQFSGRDPLPG